MKKTFFIALAFVFLATAFTPAKSEVEEETAAEVECCCDLTTSTSYHLEDWTIYQCVTFRYSCTCTGSDGISTNSSRASVECSELFD